MDTKITKAKHLDKQARREFYQSKYEYYKSFDRGLLVIAALAYISFIFTDWGIFGRFPHETLLSRFIIVVPMALFFYFYKRIEDYRIMVVLSYLMVHMIIWCTDWATYLLPDRSHAGEGMIIMNLIFVCVGFCAPYKYHIVAHCGLILDILVANLFIGYDDVMMMMMFNAPCVVAVCAVHYILENVYLDHYLVSKKLETLVVHDQLTGVFNRNKLKKISDPITEEFVIQNNAPLSVLLIDLDHFKEVNDRYGHEAGDVVLKHVAGVLVRSVRSSDFIIRWGGEEFIVVLNGCDVDRATVIAEKIRENIQQTDNTICPLTTSIGVAAYEGGSYHIVIKQADKALYQAKTEGRNRVVTYHKELEE